MSKKSAVSFHPQDKSSGSHSTLLIVLDGSGYKKGAEAWLKRQVDKKLIHVFNMSEFQKWSNNDNL